MIHFSIELAENPPRLVVTEIMPYPRQKVWVAHTEALYLEQWWAPVGYQNTWCESDAQPGGSWQTVQRDPEGNTFSFYGRFVEVSEPERLVLSVTSELFSEAPVKVSLALKEIPQGTRVVTVNEFPTDEFLQVFLRLGGVDRLRSISESLDAFMTTLTSDS